MSGPGASRGRWDRHGRPAMAWTIAALAVGAAVFSTAARPAATAPATEWIRTEASPVSSAPPTSPPMRETIVETVPVPGTVEPDSPATIIVADPSASSTTPLAAPHPATTTSTAPPPTEPENPAIVARPIPEAPSDAPAVVDAPEWTSSVRTTPAGYTATDVGCAAGLDAGSLDAFFSERIGPMIGEDYQHVVALGGGRYLWLFQDAFIDQGGTAARLDQATFVHNVALVQEGTCFTMYHRGSATAPTSFEPGTGERALTHWFWPMGGEALDGRVYQFWVRMVRDSGDPGPGDGLGWHPDGVYLAVYDAGSLARLSFDRAPASGVTPIYGYAVASDGEFTYLFGNTFEQNLAREGGYHNGPHSGTQMFLARVPLGQFGAAPEYRTADGWSSDAAAASSIVSRYWAENPMQPRYLNGQWVAATKIDGYWGEELSIDVAAAPWGPWSNVVRRALLPRDGDPLMNTYHAHLMPWLSGGALVVSVSQNARDMLRDAYPHPVRYRLQFFTEALVAPLPPDTSTTTTVAETTSTTTTTVPDTTSTTTSTTTTTTTTTTTVPPTPPTPPPTPPTEPSTTTSTTSTTSTTTSTTTPPTTGPDDSTTTAPTTPD